MQLKLFGKREKQGKETKIMCKICGKKNCARRSCVRASYTNNRWSDQEREPENIIKIWKGANFCPGCGSDDKWCGCHE